MMRSPALSFCFPLALLASALAVPWRAALADPWVPAAGAGEIKPMVRLFAGNRAFPAGGFTTSTVPASSASMTQYRLTGIQGIGDGISIEYDLRGARLRNQANVNHVPTPHVSAGLQDEEVGVNYGLAQQRDFADSVELNMIIPAGRSKAVPALGTGRWATEPDFQAGFAGGWGDITLTTGPRIFLDGNATQLRATLDLSVRVTHGLSLIGEVFAVKTLKQSSKLPPGAQGEIYNLIRPAVGVSWRMTPRLRPFLLYEVNVAGEGLHAGSQVEFGLALRY
jgi:hypothetical protein